MTMLEGFILPRGFRVFSLQSFGLICSGHLASYAWEEYYDCRNVGKVSYFIAWWTESKNRKIQEEAWVSYSSMDMYLVSSNQPSPCLPPPHNIDIILWIHQGSNSLIKSELLWPNCVWVCPHRYILFWQWKLTTAPTYSDSYVLK